jgi:biopolymer transport protein ExbD
VRLQRQGLKKARIEIIPMIDTIFFLLVFFMLASLSTVPMSAKKVRLPESTTATTKPKDKVVVTVDEQNHYFVDRAQVPFDQILPRLRQAVAANPQVTVILNADKVDQVGQLLKIMDVAKQANPGQLVMATTPRTGGGGS